MTHNPETVPTSWTTADEDFFRTTLNTFSSEFVAGAGVLLASYDDETLPVTTAVAPAASAPISVDAPAHVTT